MYILSKSAVSPQQNYEEGDFLQDIKEYSENRLTIIPPNYRNYINPVAIRRMSKLLKMGICTGMNALEKAGLESPDAIITGTGKGSMVDMETFLMQMIEQEEEALTPTAFIQSTYNSVNGWLALQTKCTGYNQTYVHRGNSFEAALLDAQMYLAEHKGKTTVLTGCYEEITDDYLIVKSKAGYWKEEQIENTDLYNHEDTEGTLAGEGAASFVLSNEQTGARCKIASVTTIASPTTSKITQAIKKALSDAGIGYGEVDVMLCGLNGDARYNPYYKDILNSHSATTSLATFKHLCGEYDTASGFGLWAAINILENNTLPEPLIRKKGTSSDYKNVLLVNHYMDTSASVILLQNV